MVIAMLCLVVLFAEGCIARGSAEEPEVRTGVTQHAGAPTITANPEQVKVADESGSTEIHWDTGNGSSGFVFVTAGDGKAGLFATGAQGSRTAPWIRAGNYVFELYGDHERRTLLAAVTVSGISETKASERAT